MITGRQIRAARALLDMSQDALAEAAGLTPQAIRKIENGTVTPREGTLSDISRVFDEHGVEFVTDRGAALKNEIYRLIEGPSCYIRLLDEIFLELKNMPGEEVLSICTDDGVSPPDVVEAIQRWHDAGIKCRFLSHERAKRFDFPINEYRLIPEQFFINSVTVIYGKKVATLQGTNQAVLIINNQDQSNMLRGLFELIWSQANKPKGENNE